LIVREDWGHQGTIFRFDARAEVTRERVSRLRRPVAVEFLDTRSDDGLYRKYRRLVAGDATIRVHMIASPHWEVRGHNKVETFQAREEEMRFLDCPDEHDEIFRGCSARSTSTSSPSITHTTRPGGSWCGRRTHIPTSASVPSPRRCSTGRLPFTGASRQWFPSTSRAPD
jgi:hypothetical protein